MPLSDRNILITPNRGSTAEPTIRFTGADTSTSATITLRVLNSSTTGQLSFEGNSGQLFSIVDSLTGSIFSVNDISGIPSIEVFDTGEIRLAQYNGFVDIKNTTPVSSTSTGALRIGGGIGVAGSGFFGGTVTATNFVGNITGSVTGSASQINTVQRTTNASHFLTFVDSDNVSSTGELLYTTGSFVVNPSTGNVGIGISNPVAKTEILTGVGTGATNSANNFSLRHSATNGNTMMLNMGVNTTGRGNDNNGYAYLQATYWGASDNQPLVLQPIGGSVLIGGTDVKASGALNYQGTLAGFAPSNTPGAYGGRIGFCAAGYVGLNAWIGSIFDGAAFSNGAGLVFATISGADVATSNGIERMRISSSGNVGINTASPSSLLHVAGNTRITGITTVTNTTQATSTVTGALQVTGGAGIGGNLYVGGEIVAQKLTIQLTTITTTLVETDDIIRTLNSTQATSTTTGALQVTGGAGIGGNLYVGGTIVGNISGTLTGSASQINTVQSSTNFVHYLTFVDNNNATTSAEFLYTTSSININPSTGNVGVGTTVTTTRLEIAGGTRISGITTITNTTQATSTTTGALQVSGGAGVGGNLHVGGDIVTRSIVNTTSNIVISTTGTSTLQVLGNITHSYGQFTTTDFWCTVAPGEAFVVESNSLNFDFDTFAFTGTMIATGTIILNATTAVNINSLLVSSSTNSTGTTTGALIVTGGAGIGQDLRVGGTIYGTLSGNSSQINTVQRTATGTHYLTFVDSNNTSSTSELLYTTNSFIINPGTGNVGFGTTSLNPNSPISLTASSVQGITLRRFGSPWGTGLYSTAANGSESSPTAFGAAIASVWEAAGYDGSDYRSLTKIEMASEGTVSSTSSPGSIKFSVTPANSTFVTEIMRVNSVGLGIGTATPTTRLDVSGGTRISGITTVTNITNASSTTTGALQVSGGAGIGRDLYVNGTVNVPAVTTPTGTLTLNSDVTNIAAINNGAASLFITNGNGSSNLYLSNVNTNQTGNIFIRDRNNNASSISVFNNSTSHRMTIDVYQSGKITIGDNNLFVGDYQFGKFNNIYFNNITDNSSILPPEIFINGGYGNTSFAANNAGGNLSLAGGRGIGNGQGGAIRFWTAGTTATSNTLQTLTERMRINTTGTVSIYTPSNSVSTSTGALVVTGGVGIGGSLYVGGEIVAQKLTIELTTVTTTLVETDDIIKTTNYTNAVSTTSGALQVAGGAGIGRDLYVGGTIYGNIVGAVSGSVTHVNTVERSTNASHYLTFVDNNNVSSVGELLYTTSSLVINPDTGNLGIGVSSPGQKLEVFGTLRLRATSNNYGDIFYNTNAYIGTDASTGIKSGNGLYYADTFSSAAHLKLGFYSHSLATGQWPNGSYSGLSYFQTSISPTIAGYNNKLLDFRGTISTGTAATETLNGLYTLVTDNSTVTNTIIGVYSDVSGGTNTVSNRYSGIFTGGNVGIGTSSPTSRLHVVSSDTSVYNFSSQSITPSDVLYLENSDQTTTGYTGIYMQHKTSGVAMARIALRGSFFDSETAALTFGLRPMSGSGVTVERMRITADGNVAIGTTVTTSLFTVAGTTQISGITTITNTTSVSSTITGALQVSGGIGVGGSGFFGGTVTATNFVGNITGAVTGAASQVLTARQTANANYFPVFVDANNASAAAESLFTTSSFAINPSTNQIIIGGPPIASNSTFVLYDNPNNNFPELAEFVSNTTSKGVRLMRFGDNSGANFLHFDKYRGSYSTSTAVQTGDVMGVLNFRAYGGSNLRRIGRISAIVETYTSDTSISSAITFETTSSGTLSSEQMRITGAGNVGIGTASPTEKLMVSGAITVSGQALANKISAGTFDFYSVDSSTRILSWGPSGVGGNISFWTGNGNSGTTEKMRISSSGNVGIGQTNPESTARLHVTGGTFILDNGTAAGNIILRGGTGASSEGAQIIMGYGNNTSSAIAGQANNTWNIDVASGSANNNLRIFRQNNSGVTRVGLEITESTGGSRLWGIGVGTDPSATEGEIRATNEITAYYSDRRLKENVKQIDNAILKVNSLNGITYTPNDVAESFGYDRNKKLVGLFADEVEAVLPEAVRLAPFDSDENGNSKSGENYKTIQYEKLVPLLIEAIKEQQKTIEEQNRKIQEQNEKIAEILKSLG